jgi:hypothetical protein
VAIEGPPYCRVKEIMAKGCRFRKRTADRVTLMRKRGKDVCVFHDPGEAADGRRARQAGGRNRPRTAAVLPDDTPDHPLANTQQVSDFLAESSNRLRRGQLDPKVANALGYLVSFLLRSLDQGTEERVAGVAVTDSTFRERLKSMWLLRKEMDNDLFFRSRGRCTDKVPTHGHDDKR